MIKITYFNGLSLKFYPALSGKFLMFIHHGLERETRGRGDSVEKLNHPNPSNNQKEDNNG